MQGGNERDAGEMGTQKLFAGSRRGCAIARRLRRRKPSAAFVLFALVVEAVSKLLEFGLLLGGEDSTDALAALPADLVSLGVERRIEGAHLSASVVHDFRDLLHLVAGKLKLASELGEDLVATVRN